MVLDRKLQNPISIVRKNNAPQISKRSNIDMVSIAGLCILICPGPPMRSDRSNCCGLAFIYGLHRSAGNGLTRIVGSIVGKVDAATVIATDRFQAE